MAHAEVEEQQLLKAMTWWDGFVVALANPGFLLAALGGSIGVLGTTGAFVLCTIFWARCRTTSTPTGGDVPAKSGGIELTTMRRGASTPIGAAGQLRYWIGWSSAVDQTGSFGHASKAEWFSDRHGRRTSGPSLQPADRNGIA